MYIPVALFQAESLLKALYFITPGHRPVHSRTFSTPWGAQNRAADSRPALQATQQQIPSLPARYPFNTWAEVR
jgi:hypothetical protein